MNNPYIRVQDLRDTAMQNWRERAACDGDWRLFDPPEDEPHDTLTIRLAVSICQRCRVIAQCRKESRDDRFATGVWAGVDRGGISTGPSAGSLAERRMLVAQMTARGLSRAEIGRRLGMSPNLVRWDLKALEPLIVVEADAAS